MAALGAAGRREPYHRLLRLLPRGPWIPRGGLQRMLHPFPRQQECGLQVLEQMERYGVMPDAETRFLLLGIFGPRSRPVRKCQRMLYWLPRLRHADPHPLPPRLPPPGLAAARLGLRRIANDPDARLTVYQVGGAPGGAPRPLPGGSGVPPHSLFPPQDTGGGHQWHRGPPNLCFELRHGGGLIKPGGVQTSLTPTRGPPQAVRARSSASCWPGTAPSARCSSRAPSPCGCAAPAWSTTCCGETPCPPTCG
uniref:ECSIT N-terminal domain-containing protein n=1 Tax=Cairina moschata TaxID=8855 RepID=A0A8C3CM42_CAIMO